MHELTRPPRATRRRLARPERVSASVQDLIDNWTTTPALVQGAYMKTLAANSMAVALSPFFAPASTACGRRSWSRKCASSTATGMK
jgi:hypothetical protein